MSYTREHNKRYRDEYTIDNHRLRISELLLQHYAKKDIQLIVKDEFGFDISMRQLNNDIEQIQIGWIATANLNYDLMINQELARLDALETELWKQLRISAEPKVKEVIDRLPMRGELTKDDLDYIISKVQSTKESGAVNPVFFSRIIDVQKERRRLLGMYAPKKIDIDMRHTVNVKGYDIVSPDDWDDAIEGKVIEKIEAHAKETNGDKKENVLE